ncbi:MAG: hypothetical protein IAI50_21430, partial [Candidatus Eremiobacteraeota bacterium]|nr:hypothetical protein [Candidatus Eremiobacteraeota bacterium]
GLYASRTRVATFKSRYAIAYENDIPIWICREPQKALSAVWPEIKDYE